MVSFEKKIQDITSATVSSLDTHRVKRDEKTLGFLTGQTQPSEG